MIEGDFEASLFTRQEQLIRVLTKNSNFWNFWHNEPKSKQPVEQRGLRCYWDIIIHSREETVRDR